jgi:hypothetical protein
MPDFPKYHALVAEHYGRHNGFPTLDEAKSLVDTLLRELGLDVKPTGPQMYELRKDGHCPLVIVAVSYPRLPLFNPELYFISQEETALQEIRETLRHKNFTLSEL